MHRARLTANRCLPALAAAAMLAACGEANQEHEPQAEARSSRTHVPEHAAWSVDPYEPGPDLPPVGRSLFDFLVSDAGEGGRAVPFPFPALLELIETRLQPGASSPTPFARVLIPLGRSLQRDAAAPAFFHYPRAIAAATDEAAHRDGKVFATNRLFLGYQEKSGLIEVISYNEAAGRFEFQVVRDYRAGATPRVVYANRTLCTACHQNAAPIFPRPLWEETNANPAVAALLRAEKREFYGFPIDQGVDVANAVDNATDEANLIAPLQRIWSEVCGKDEPAAIECRADLLELALQYRLRGRRPVDTDSAAYRERFKPRFVAGWQQRWPNGLWIPDPDIPNRDPFAQFADDSREPAPATFDPASGAPAGLELFSGVPVAFEPLRPRRPLESWVLDGAADERIFRVVAGLGDMFSARDITLLDKWLSQAGDVAVEDYDTECEIESGNLPVRRYKLRCRQPPHASVASAIEGRIFEQPDGAISVSLTKVSIDDDAYTALAVRQSVKHAGDEQMGIDVSFRQRTGLHARTKEGDALTSIGFTWPVDPSRAADGKAMLTGKAVLHTRRDFGRLAHAIAGLEQRARDGVSDALSSRPLRRAIIMQQISEALGTARRDWCCVDASHLPEPITDEDSGSRAAADSRPTQGEANLALFHDYCGSCHGTPESFPPNFLTGDAPQVKTRLAHCAERIFYRLSLWQMDEQAQSRIPMPPRQVLPGFGIAPDEWAQHPDLAALRAQAAIVLTRDTGAAPDIHAMHARGYDKLRSCLPGT